MSLTAKEIRDKFFTFFQSKGHLIVNSAPIVNKNDPSLMFTNAGMNQFKDYFLGNNVSPNSRVADTQKCLRVSGKHNDLEEVGIDSYHHTMFEMLGNWSFGDYFKKESIAWAWELLTKEYGLDKDRLYATCFEGDESEGLEQDSEAADYWKEWLDEDRILYCGKKDNFWEMGASGPCGPCSEIHIDLRDDDERAQVSGRDLVNKDHPLVVEIWNLVFIQYNRKADGSLESLPAKHIDTGMGFERLCMAIQQKKSNYDTDIFRPFIKHIEEATGIEYTGKYTLNAKSDIAMRVIVDHLRAVSFTIADGELPSNTGAGYVIRRILRRAVRYYYSFLDVKEPLMYKLVWPLAESFKSVFPELSAQREFVAKVILEEEKSFLRTLEEGLKRLDKMEPSKGMIDGKSVFELYDTYGFPIDLTKLIAEEKGWKIDELGFEQALQAQKQRGRDDAKKVAGDWMQIRDVQDVLFVGYDDLEVEGVQIIKHRTVLVKDRPQYQLVLNVTPFYAEGGGQVGDIGQIKFGQEWIRVLDTIKENNLIIHQVDRLPEDVEASGQAIVNNNRRQLIENNHSATHLLHAALRHVLGTHVHQKGSLVNDKYLRFDFSHFQKVTDEELAKIEGIVNQQIRRNILLTEDRSIPISEAEEKGAMMLFGEKYGDTVRMITFDPAYSIELCGGCHVNATGEIGLLKITSEGAIAAGVRRIEAITADAAELFVNQEIEELNTIRGFFKNPNQVSKSVYDLKEENKSLLKTIEDLKTQAASSIQQHLRTHFENVAGINILSQVVDLDDAKIAKTMAYNLEKEVGNAVIILGFESGDKAQIMVVISENLTKDGKLHAGKLINSLAKEIGGGGGGQAFFATAGGPDVNKLQHAIDIGRSMVMKG